MSTDLLKRAEKSAHDKSNQLHYQWNDQSWGNAPADVFEQTRKDYARKTRQYLAFGKELSRREREGS